MVGGSPRCLESENDRGVLKSISARAGSDFTVFALPVVLFSLLFFLFCNHSSLMFPHGLTMLRLQK